MDGASESPGLREKPLEVSMEIKELCLISRGSLHGAREMASTGGVSLERQVPIIDPSLYLLRVKVDRCRLCVPGW